MSLYFEHHFKINAWTVTALSVVHPSMERDRIVEDQLQNFQRVKEKKREVEKSNVCVDLVSSARIGGAVAEWHCLREKEKKQVQPGQS